MARVSINEFTTYRWSFEQDVIEYSNKGFAGISVWRQKLSDFGESKGVELLRKQGLGVASLLWAGGFTGSDGRSFQESVQDARDAIHLAASLQAETLVIFSGGRSGHTHNHARRLLTQGLQQLAPLALERGVKLGLEPVHPRCAESSSFITDLDDAVEILDRLDCLAVGLVLDVYYWGLLPDIVPRAEQLAKRTCLVQIGDGRFEPDAEQNRCPLGEGIIPLREIVAALQAGGYDGYYDVELVGEEIEHLDNHMLLDRTRAACEQILSLTTVS